MAARRRIHTGRAVSRPRLRASSARCVPALLATRRRSEAQLSARCTASGRELSPQDAKRLYRDARSPNLRP
jgi:hypothetical protein